MTVLPALSWYMSLWAVAEVLLPADLGGLLTGRPSFVPALRLLAGHCNVCYDRP